MGEWWYEGLWLLLAVEQDFFLLTFLLGLAMAAIGIVGLFRG